VAADKGGKRMNYMIKPIVSNYAVIRIGTKEIVCICNIKRNAELIADILNGDSDNYCAYSYDLFPNAKYKIVKAEGEDKLDGDPIDTGKAIEHYEGTLEALKGIDLEVQDDTNGEGYRGDNFYNL
jgi:hypothetical protein